MMKARLIGALSIGMFAAGCASDLPAELGASQQAQVAVAAAGCPVGFAPWNLGGSAILSSNAVREFNTTSYATNIVDSGIFGPNSFAYRDAIMSDVAVASNVAADSTGWPLVVPGIGTGVLTPAGVPLLTGLAPGIGWGGTDSLTSFASDAMFGRSTGVSSVRYGVFGPDVYEAAFETASGSSVRNTTAIEGGWGPWGGVGIGGFGLGVGLGVPVGLPAGAIGCVGF